MTIIGLLLLLLAVVLVCLVCYWVINKFFPEPMRTPALIVVGVVALLVLLLTFWPNALNVKVGG